MLCGSSNTRTFQSNDSGITIQNGCHAMLFLMQSQHCFLYVHHTTAMSHKMVTLSLSVITVIPHLCHTTAMPVTQQCALSVGVTQCCCSTQNYCHTHVFSIIVSHHDYFGTWLMEVCLFVFLN